MHDYKFLIPSHNFKVSPEGNAVALQRRTRELTGQRFIGIS